MDSIFRRPVRVLRRDAPAKIRALLEARGFIETRGWEARAIDLRFADRIVLVGAYGAGNLLMSSRTGPSPPSSDGSS